MTWPYGRTEFSSKYGPSIKKIQTNTPTNKQTKNQKPVRYNIILARMEDVHVDVSYGSLYSIYRDRDPVGMQLPTPEFYTLDFV